MKLHDGERNMFNESFEELRGKVLEEMREKDERLLKHFFGIINYKGIVVYKNDLSGKIFRIWTDQPCILIGKGGKNVEILKEILKEEFNHDYTIDFKEIKGRMLIIL